MEKYRQPFHNKIPNGDKILDQLKYQQKKISLELQRRRSFVLNPLVDLVSQDVQMIKALYNFFPYTFFEFEIYNNLRGHIVSYRSISLSSPLNLTPSTYQETQS